MHQPGAAGDYPNGQFALVVNNSNPDMKSQAITIRDNVFDGTKFGGIFLIGEGHKVLRNKLLNLNKWHCNEGLDNKPCPVEAGQEDLLSAGIYLGEKAQRLAPSKGITIEDNEITGYGMKSNCVVTSLHVEAKANTVRNNRCSDAN
ncbi:MAG: hypothetical protein R2762_08875 [Bryobacteraceae bacterium]